MKLETTFVILLGIACVLVGARPPQKTNTDSGSQAKAQAVNSSEMELGLEYNRYLQEVVQILEGDPDFRKKLESVDAVKIKDGTIARELELVGHHVRTQLDDVKRKELDRLRNAAMRQYELNMGLDRKHIIAPDHLQIDSARFEVEDLKRLIQSTTRDLEEADRKRAEDFKRYEMEKKFENESRLRHIEKEEDREKERHKIDDSISRHKKHDKVNHPMTKDQLEEVWEEQDHMKAQDWDPKTFFAMHDLNGDRQWDENELKVLFIKELDKVYDPNNRDDDMREREEEMERMREHVLKESDKDKNRLISFEEFMAETRKEEYNKDPGWDTIDQHEEDIFSEKEYNQFKDVRQREMDYMIEHGMVPSEYPFFGEVPPGAMPLPGQQGYPPPGYQPPPHPSQFNNQYPPPHPGQVPQQHFQQPHPSQQQNFNQGQHPNMGNNPGQAPMQQPNFNPGQHPNMGNNPGQIPMQQQHFQQPIQNIPNNQPGQIPQQQQFQQPNIPNNAGHIPQQQQPNIPNHPGQQQFQKNNNMNPGGQGSSQFNNNQQPDQGVRNNLDPSSSDKVYQQPQPRGNPPIRSQGPTGSRSVNEKNIPPNQGNPPPPADQQQQPNPPQQHFQNRP
uniref:EFhand protein NUCB1 [Nasonia vitripennis] n=1 Tax=Lepeophtheirus salmonis TaxID=72036 RepID=A0A0K2VGS6_LEPSM